METQKEFRLESILSVITGYVFTNSIDEVLELFWFMYDDPFIDTTGIYFLRKEAKKHILNIHPELKSVKLNKKDNKLEWINNQIELFGDTLQISKIGKPLDNTKQPTLCL